jgi:RNA polymerase-binding transcription factor DksA
MAKRKTGNHKLTAKQLEQYKNLLLEKRQELLGDVSCMEETVFQGSGEISNMPVHMADIGTDSYEQEFSLGLMAEGKKILVEIDRALLRIEDGSYGICEGLGVPIEKNRLEAIPWTRYSLEYAQKKEKGQPRNNLRLRPLDIERDDDSQEHQNTENDEVEQEESPDTEEQETGLPDSDGDLAEDDQTDPDEQYRP